MRAGALVSLVFLGALAIACGPTPPAKTAGKKPESKVVATKITAPPGVALVTACTPTGPELCFNAIDDNCNGVIEEGCGVATGLLQFIASWGEAPADVDLILIGPNDERIASGAPATATGFKLDKDCKGDNCGGQNIENIYYDGPEPPRGRYTIELTLPKLGKAELPVKVRLGARVGSRTFGADVELTKEEDKKTFTFEL
jgi:hypothetical protein